MNTPPPPPTQFQPMDESEMKAAAEARKARRAAISKLVGDAGLDPSQVDMTKVMTDEEQAVVVAQMAAIRAAKELASDVGRQGLRERLKKTVAIHQATVERHTCRLEKKKVDP